MKATTITCDLCGHIIQEKDSRHVIFIEIRDDETVAWNGWGHTSKSMLNHLLEFDACEECYKHAQKINWRSVICAAIGPGVMIVNREDI